MNLYRSTLKNLGWEPIFKSELYLPYMTGNIQGVRSDHKRLIRRGMTSSIFFLLTKLVIICRRMTWCTKSVQSSMENEMNRNAYKAGTAEVQKSIQPWQNTNLRMETPKKNTFLSSPTREVHSAYAGSRVGESCFGSQIISSSLWWIIPLVKLEWRGNLWSIKVFQQNPMRPSYLVGRTHHI